MIKSNQTDKFYVGSTIKDLKIRLQQHKKDFKRFQEGRYANVSSFEIVKFDDCYIELLENFECHYKKDLLIREGFYIKLYANNVVNKYIAGQTPYEYKMKNIEKINQKKNEILNCSCGKKYTRTNYSHHIKTKYHLNAN